MFSTPSPPNFVLFGESLRATFSQRGLVASEMFEESIEVYHGYILYAEGSLSVHPAYPNAVDLTQLLQSVRERAQQIYFFLRNYLRRCVVGLL